MLYRPRIKNNICTNAHPVGCFYNVFEQSEIAARTPFEGVKTALVVGASSGIGLASRNALAFGAKADTLGVYFDRPAQAHKFGSAGWYNNQAFEYYARRSGRIALSTNQDAFQQPSKDWVIQKLRMMDRKLDLLVYSLASPKRTVKGVGEYRSTIKPIDEAFEGVTVDPFEAKLRDIHIDPANADEVEATVKVMGGEDWQNWVNLLKKEGVLADNFKTIAYSYLGPEQTQDIYGSGTLGCAKSHLHETAVALDHHLSDLNGQASIGLLQALVTPSSSVIPSMPLYLSVLHKTLKEAGKYESTLDQVARLFSQGLYGAETPTQAGHKYRVDDLERHPDIQQKVDAIFRDINQDNLTQLADVDGFKQAFLQQFGFDFDFINYEVRPDPLTPPALHDFSIQSMQGEKAYG